MSLKLMKFHQPDSLFSQYFGKRFLVSGDAYLNNEIAGLAMAQTQSLLPIKNTE